MARYIDADELIAQVVPLEQLARKRVYDTPTNSPAYERYATQYYEREKALSIIKAQPTADVIPKAKVEEMLQQIDTLIVEYLDGLYMTGEFLEIFTELKKRYTEELK